MRKDQIDDGKSQQLFFEKIYKIDSLLARLRNKDSKNSEMKEET